VDSLDSAALTGAWGARVAFSNVGVHTLAVLPFDATGRQLKDDSTRIQLTTYQPTSGPAWQARFWLVDGSPADSATVAITRQGGEVLYTGFTGAEGVLQLPKFPADTYAVDIWKIRGNDTLRAQQRKVAISDGSHELADDTLYAAGTLMGTVSLSNTSEGKVTDAIVTVPALNRQIKPDSTGNFILTGLATGSHELVIRMPDTTRYKTTAITITVQDAWVPVILPGVIVIEHYNRPPELLPVNDLTVLEQQKIEFTVMANDFDGDTIIYSVDKSKLPPLNGATFDSLMGIFSWTPTFDDAGVYSLTFRASDGKATDEAAMTITVTDTKRPPVVSPIPDDSVAVGGIFSAIDLNAHVVDSAYADSQIVWTTNTSNFFSISISAGRIATITPKASQWSGSEAITFTATNPDHQSASSTATFTVKAITDGRLIKNGSFESTNGLGGILNWTFEGDEVQMASVDWASPGVEGRGSHCTAIIHATGNASRWVQTVTGLTPGTLYKVSGYIKGENLRAFGESYLFAHLSRVDGGETSGLTYYFEGTFDWKYAEFTFTAPESGSAIIACNLGNMGTGLDHHQALGTAWFDGVSLTPVVR
jgi:hypothetical protein